jgi:protein required for attachment to host cells
MTSFAEVDRSNEKHRKSVMTNTWILVADRSRAKIFHAVPETHPPYMILAEFEHPESRQKAQEAESDSPGRVQLRGASRSAVEPHTDRAHLTAQHLASELIDCLKSACQERRFEKLVVVAPPLFLGTLRAMYTPQLQQKILLEVSKDLVGLKDADLQLRLADLLSQK